LNLFGSHSPPLAASMKKETPEYPAPWGGDHLLVGPAGHGPLIPKPIVLS
jgi:hypothetical protein